MAATKKTYDAIYSLVTALADNYGFDADAAMEVIESETDVNHIAVLTDMVKPAKKTPETKVVVKKEEAPKEEEEEEKSDDGKKSPLEKTRHNVQLWTKKLEANKFKDEAAKQKHSEKLDKERKKLEKLEPAEKKEEAKPAPKTKAAPAKEEKAKPEKKEKRISRWTKTNHDVHFKTALKAIEMEPTDDLKKEFLKYVDDLTDDDWKRDGKTYADHMRDFAKLKVPATEAKLEEDTVPVFVHTIPISEMKTIGILTPIEKVGQFWDGDNGRFVTGPDENGDEDFGDPVEVDGAEYIIGEKTGRVYEVRESGDVFAGFMGIGKFKEIDM